MIYIDQFGRCGNQLFHYAVARKLSLLYPGQGMTFILTSQEQDGKGCGDQLKYFNVAPYSTEYKTRYIEKYGTTSQRFMHYLSVIINKPFLLVERRFNLNVDCSCLHIFVDKVFFKTAQKVGLYYAKYCFTKYKEDYSVNKFVSGTFEDSRWFDDIKEVLLREVTPIRPVAEHNIALLHTIINTNSVCVSLRKWGWNPKGDAEQVRNANNRMVCDEEYYRKAISIICDAVKDPVFIVFSDDIAWAKTLVSGIANNVTVLAETGSDDVAEKLRLMYSCKHFILSNSTFCWWAQYLCQSNGKIVVSPGRWFRAYKNYNPWIQDGWVLVNIDE